MSETTVGTNETDLGAAAKLFHALGDKTRLQILLNLRSGERCVCDLTDACCSAQSRLSYHLRVLKDAGLVLDRREGRWSHYRIATGAEAVAACLIQNFVTTCSDEACGCPTDALAHNVD